MFKIIHHFIGDEGILREIKWLNMDEDATEDELLEWQWVPFGFDPIKLTFKSAAGNTRRFEQGSLTFDHMSATLIYYDRTFSLNRSK